MFVADMELPVRLVSKVDSSFATLSDEVDSWPRVTASCGSPASGVNVAEIHLHVAFNQCLK
jgi:hypothetical protein